MIKVENPAGGDPARNNAPYVGRDRAELSRTDADDMSLSMLERGRNKRSVTLNLKHPEALDVFADLVRQADVVVENFSGGTADRIGIGYASASEVNPRRSCTSDQRLRRGRARKGHGHDLPGALGADAMSGSEVTRRCGTVCRSATWSGRSSR